MCGIYGYIGTPKDPIKAYKIMKALAIATEVRGIDSAGIAALNDTDMYHEKKTVPASEFYAKVDVQKVIKDGCFFFLGHNRWASMGAITEDNAHPFIGERFMFAHNGTVDRAKTLINALQLKTVGQTDSEALMVLAEKYGLNVLKKMYNLSIAAIDYKNRNGVMYFYRDRQKPMVMCDIRDVAGIVIFASTKEILEKGLQEFTATNYKYFLKRAVETKERELIRYEKNGDHEIINMKKVSIDIINAINATEKKAENKKQTKTVERVTASTFVPKTILIKGGARNVNADYKFSWEQRNDLPWWKCKEYRS